MWKYCWIGLFIGLPVSGQWQLLDDFQQWEDDDHFVDADDIGWHAYSEKGADGYRILELQREPGNRVLWVEPGGRSYDDRDDVFLQKELTGGGILPGETGTLFWRTYWSSWGYNWAMGTTDRDIAYDADTGLQTVPGEWSDYNALIRTGLQERIEHRDGGGYVSTDPPVLMQINQWYTFWMVVENTWDTSATPPVCTGKFSLYVQSPDDPSPVLVPVGTDPPKEKASFRRPPADEDGTPRAITLLNYATNTQAIAYGSSSMGPHFLDDFYFSKGANLTNPLLESEGWGGLPLQNENGDVDTGEWFHWINVRRAPHIWSYALDGWLYIADPAPEDPGVWAYFYK